MNEAPQHYAAPADPVALVAMLRKRFQECNLSYAEVERRSGLADGHVGKILGPSMGKGIGLKTIYLLLPVAGLAVCFVEDPEALKRFSTTAPKGNPNQARRNNYAQRPGKRVLSRVQRHFGRRGARVTNSKLTAEQRSENARVAAMKRWHPTYSWEAIKRAAIKPATPPVTSRTTNSEKLV